MVSHQRVVRDTAEFGLVRMVALLAVIFPLAGLIQVLANMRDYKQPVVAVAIWLAMFPVAAWLVPRVGTDGLSRGEALAAILIAIAAVAGIGWEHRAAYASGQINLAVLGTTWLLALVALSRPARVWVPAALMVLAVHAALLTSAVRADLVSLTELEAAGYIVVSTVIAFAALRPTIATHTSISAHRASLESKSAAERAAAAAVQEDRQARLALLETEALPLLRAIADGTLNPAVAEIRERCAQHAAALRRSLTDRAPTAEELMAWLEPALRTAGTRGLLVDIQVVGDPAIPAQEVGAAVLRTVEAVLGALSPHQVMLTVLASGDDVELYMTFSRPLRAPLDLARFGRDVPAAARWHATIEADASAAGCLEISWRKDGAA